MRGSWTTEFRLILINYDKREILNVIDFFESFHKNSQID